MSANYDCIIPAKFGNISIGRLVYTRVEIHIWINKLYWKYIWYNHQNLKKCYYKWVTSYYNSAEIYKFSLIFAHRRKILSEMRKHAMA